MSVQAKNFALNHMACPGLSPLELVDAAADLGMGAIELRNDVKQNSIADLDTARAVARRAKEKGLEVLSINALYPFNIWNDERAAQAENLAALCGASGAIGLVCCPLVSAEYSGSAEDKITELKNALRNLKPILEKHGIQGFVEVLGFPISTLRYKQDAIDAIKEVGGEERFGLVHDTFHHRGARETVMFPKRTGLVHVSAVLDKDISFEDMLDAHRFFVGPGDRLDSIDQVKELLAGGYQGYISFEPFFDDLWNLQDPIGAVRESMDYMIGELAD